MLKISDRETPLSKPELLSRAVTLTLQLLKTVITRFCSILILMVRTKIPLGHLHSFHLTAKY